MEDSRTADVGMRVTGLTMAALMSGNETAIDAAGVLCKTYERYISASAEGAPEAELNAIMAEGRLELRLIARAAGVESALPEEKAEVA